MAVTIENKFEIVAVQYIKKVAEEEMISMLAKSIRKQSRKLAREIIENMNIDVVLKQPVDSSKGFTLATRIRRSK